MAHLGMTVVSQEVERLFSAGSMAGLTDAQLLERFNRRRDECGEAAFAEIVARHGPMVLGVCRRIFDDPHLADDAFQATFLVLARKARTVSRVEWLGAWLHAVAVRVARCERRRHSRRLRREEVSMTMLTALESADGPSAPPPEAAMLASDEASVLHAEIARLPNAFRLPVVLCYLEGLTVHEAAHRLRISHGTIRSRMARAREKLRRRLVRRGIVAPASVIAALFDGPSASATIATPLAAVTTRAAAQFAVGTIAHEGAATTAAALAVQVLKEMAVPRVITAGLAVAVLAAVVGGAWLVALALSSGDEPTKVTESQPPPDAQPAEPPALAAVPGDAVARTVRVKILDPDGLPAPNTKVHTSIWTDEKDFQPNRDYPTDAAGVALVALPKSYTIVRLFVSRPPLVSMFTHWEEKDLKAGKTIPDEYTIRLERGASAGGRVLDETGKPIAGARVQVTLNKEVRPADAAPQTYYGSWLAEKDDAAITDADGRWRIDNVPRNAKFKFRGF